MSTAHEYHVRDEAGLPILCDECPRCEEQAGDLGIHLDSETWGRAWREMIRVEYRDDGAFYKSAADKKLGSSLYVMSLILERRGIDPRLFA